VTELTLFVLQLAFLALLWVFVFAIVYALRTDLFGPSMRRSAEQGSSKAPPTPISGVPTAGLTGPPSGIATRLVVTSGPKEGLDIPLDREQQFTIGRSAESSLIVRDDFTSTHHARLMLWNDQWMVQDLDSTNGTFIEDRRVNIPTPVALNTPVHVGNTTFELRR
jgi:pSer/pThr/pTyr-binding forkhead associated (FHA) protein